MPLVSIPLLYKNNLPTDAADGNDVLYKKKFLIDEYRSRRFKSCRSSHKKYLQETSNFALNASIAKKKKSKNLSGKASLLFWRLSLMSLNHEYEKLFIRFCKRLAINPFKMYYRVKFCTLRKKRHEKVRIICNISVIVIVIAQGLVHFECFSTYPRC